jgi:microcystin-dependent protein
MPTTTTHLGLSKPLVNSPTDEDLWGDQLNANMDLLDAAVFSAAPSGAMSMFGGSVVPTGFLECNGAAVSRTTYAALLAAIGTTFGVGDGSTTFNVPDMRGYFARGWDHGRGIDAARALGSTQADDNLSHNHTASVTDPGHVHLMTNQGSQSANSTGGGVGTHNGADSSFNTNSATTGITVTNTASGGTEARPKNIALMFIIKT